MVEENKTAIEHDEEHIRKCASLQGRHGKIQDIPMERAKKKDNEGTKIQSHKSFSILENDVIVSREL
jgi:hypothetical protein